MRRKPTFDEYIDKLLTGLRERARWLKEQARMTQEMDRLAREAWRLSKENKHDEALAMLKDAEKLRKKLGLSSKRK